MKIKSLLLGSVAAAGLSTGAFAADLNVLTSLDVCDALGITGLTISSDTNCLQITGEVKYEFQWGDYAGTQFVPSAALIGGNFNIPNNNGTAPTELDWYSRVDAYLKFVGTADSDFGPASATITFGYDDDYFVVNETVAALSAPAGQFSNTLTIDEAFVSVGDSTMLMAGLKGSIANMGDDKELTWISLYNSDLVAGPGTHGGVETGFLDRADTGPSHVIQVVSDLGNGFSAGIGLENLNGVNNEVAVYGGTPTADDGTLVGTVAYAGDTITAHGTVVAGGFLDGTIEVFGFHGGVTATVDMFKFVAALAADSRGEWNALASASATFDIFTLAIAIEGDSGPEGIPGAADQWGFAASGTAAVTDTVTINLGGRWTDTNINVANNEYYQLAAALVFAATESITLTGEVGYHGTTVPGNTDVFYGSAEVAWAPGGDFTTSLKGEVGSNGGYSINYKAKKSFK